MYGMVNKALEDMIRSQHGDAAWDNIKEKANVTVEIFISNEGYPDGITYDLVRSAADVLGKSPSDILEAFGEWWILKTGRQGYGGLLDAAGRTVREFLVNLPNFHSRISLMYPKLQPPRFEVSHLADQSLHLHYSTHREGLTPMMIGLLRGIGTMYGTPVRVSLVESRSAGAPHDVFLVEW